MSPAKARDYRVIAVAAAAATLVATTGALLTELGPWYYALRKPAWQPPDWLFGPAWTLIFALCAAAGAKAWSGAAGRSARVFIVVTFALNAALNMGWSFLFFTLSRPAWALAEVTVLWLSVLALIVVIRQSSRAAGWLLAPYLAWVSFAAFLNLAIVKLNPGLT